MELANPSSPHNHVKLDKYLARQRHLAPMVITTLVSITELFTEVKKLKANYGVDTRAWGEYLVKLRDMAFPSPTLDCPAGDSKARQKIEHGHRNLDLLRECKFVLVDDSLFHKLSIDIRYRLDDLLTLCTPQLDAAIARTSIPEILKKDNDLNALVSLSDTAKEEAKIAKNDDQPYDLYEGIAAAARLKAQILNPKAPLPASRMVAIDSYEYHRAWQVNLQTTISLCHEYDRIEYIEWKSYRSIENRCSKEMEGQILELINKLCIERHPPQLQALEFLFYFKDAETCRYGLVYQLPEYIRKFRTSTSTPKIKESQIAARCRPTNLLSILTAAEINPDGILELGLRFQLAKRLINSVHWMHTAGWLHQSIRSTNLLFFPEQSRFGLWPSELKPQRLDIGRPYLMGSGDEIMENEQLRDHAAARSRSTSPKLPGYVSFDIYQHPAKLSNPKRAYSPTFDFYALGLLLLEIGLWQRLASFHRPDDKPEAFRKRLIEVETGHLRGQCGAVYAEVVRKCLSAEVTDSMEESVRVLGYLIAAGLDHIQA